MSHFNFHLRPPKCLRSGLSMNERFFFIHTTHWAKSVLLFEGEMKKKYALFIDPDSNEEDYVVVAIYFLYKRLAFIKAGDKS